MNHQASKLVYPLTDEEAEQLTEAFDGVLEDVFACPTCGRIESRRAAPPPARP
jgi:recombinational DNA repair protein RecR